MDKHFSPIGVFDSGVGGISVLRTLYHMYPNESYVYFGDTKNAPYGTKSKDEVEALSEKAVCFLLEKGIKAVVIACNTATGAAAQELREKYTFPIIGMEPAIKPASQMRHGGIVLSLATPGTLHSEKYAHLSEKYGDGVLPLPCPGLMEFVERGDTDSPALHAYLEQLLSPYRDAQVDAVVLGCTHYVFLRTAVKKHFSPSTCIIDGNQGTARQLGRRLAECDLVNPGNEKGSISFFTSGDEKSLALMHTLFVLPE